MGNCRNNGSASYVAGQPKGDGRNPLATLAPCAFAAGCAPARAPAWVKMTPNMYMMMRRRRIVHIKERKVCMTLNNNRRRDRKMLMMRNTSGPFGHGAHNAEITSVSSWNQNKA